MTPTLSRLKKPFGTAKMVDLTAVRYLAWEDAFEVDFADGLTFLEPHSSNRKANRISSKAVVERVEMDRECQEGFFVHYDNGQNGGSVVGVHPRTASPKDKMKITSSRSCTGGLIQIERSGKGASACLRLTGLFRQLGSHRRLTTHRVQAVQTAPQRN
jgi:hypothetical protein